MAIRRLSFSLACRRALNPDLPLSGLVAMPSDSC